MCCCFELAQLNHSTREVQVIKGVRDTWKTFASSWEEKNPNQCLESCYCTTAVRRQNSSCLCLSFELRASHSWLRPMARCIWRCVLSGLCISHLSPYKAQIAVSVLLKDNCFGELAEQQATCVSDKDAGFGARPQPDLPQEQ